MTTAAAATHPADGGRAWRWLGVVLPLAIAYAPALRWVFDSWLLEDSYWSHGPLVPLVMAFALWRHVRSRAAAGTAARPDARGWLLLLPALALHLAGVALTIDSLSAASLVLAVPGAAWLAFGRGWLRGVWPALWLPAFAVPLPLFVSGRLAFELKEVAVTFGLGLANLLGLGGRRDGAYLFVPGQDEPLLVADPCSGLRSLLALLTLGWCMAFVLGRSRGGRALLLFALAGVLALALNVVRIAALCFLARGFGVATAVGTGHDLVNAAVWIVAIVTLVWLDRRLVVGERRA